MLTAKTPIRVVLSGSGTLFYYHIGALQRICQTCKIEEGVGASGGALVLAFLAAGYTPDEFEDIALQLDLSQHLDVSLNPLDKMGLIKGDKFRNLIHEFLRININEAKFPITIVTTSYTKKVARYFTSTFDKLPLADIVRASMSIPMLFKYVKIENDILLDGGVVNNFPVSTFDATIPCVGIKIEGKWTADSNTSKPFSLLSPFKSLFDYCISLIEIMMATIEKKHMEDAQYTKTLVIKTDKNGTKFDYTKEEKRAMIREGYDMAHEFISRHPELIV